MLLESSVDDLRALLTRQRQQGRDRIWPQVVVVVEMQQPASPCPTAASLRAIVLPTASGDLSQGRR